jgi:outer membrane protein, adhesin transport system
MKTKLKAFKQKAKYIYLSALLTLTIGFAYAQEVYTLSRCIETGLEQNFALKVSRNQEQIASNNYSPGNAGMLPKITTTNRFGGTLNSSNQQFTDGSDKNTTAIHNNFGSASVDLNMTIFRGLQVQQTYRKLSVLHELGTLQTQMAIENLTAKIVSEYYFYIQQLILYENLGYAVSLSRERVRIDEERYLLGSASKLELLQSMVYLNADSSRYARQNEVLRSAQIRINELMGSEDIGKNIVPADSLINIDETLSYQPLLDETLVQNTSIRIALKNKNVSELDYKIISSRAYPYLNLNTGYAYNYNSYGSGEMANQQVRGLNYGLSLGMDLFDGFNRRRERNNARIEIESRQIQQKEVEQTIKADLLTIYYAYENNLRLLRLEEENLQVARENLEIALERYKLGSLAGLELREVQKSLLDAEERLISVKFQTKLAEVSLFQISGKIMEYL